MDLRVGDCILLRTCPDSPDCYFIGPIEFLPHSYSNSEKAYLGFGMIKIIITNCPKRHSSVKYKRGFYPEEIEAGKVEVWL